RIYLVLSHLGEPLTMSQLSEILAVPSSTATRMVDWMVDGGYVERLHDHSDRRIVRVAMTELGQDVHRAVKDFVRHRVERLLHQFTPEERGELVSLLDKLLTILEEEAAQQPPRMGLLA
ncbi:MAG: MarR family transcriptional regulator, partial [Chloroflexota bacterium]